MIDIGQPKQGETVVVSGAAGAVGSIAGQIAKIRGCRVVGFAGTDPKCSWLSESLGFDAAINYRTGDIESELDAACPDGIDVYFDNTGGWSGPSNYESVLVNRLTVRGFITLDHADRYPEAIDAMSGWMAEGKLKARNEIVDGLENAVGTCKRLFSGEHEGKLMVRVQEITA